MFKKIVEYFKTIKDNKGGIVSLVGISLIIFIVTLAVYFVANYVVSNNFNDDLITGWNYLYTDNAGETPKSELRVYNSQTPIITEKAVKKSNIYLTKTFEPSGKKKTLVLLCDHSPIKIKLNGREVYNNQFETAEFTGNSYNAIVLNSSEREQTVEVFMKLPLSVKFEASFSNNANPKFNISFGFVLGCIVALLGIISLIICLFMAYRLKEKVFSFVVAFLATYLGLAMALYSFSKTSYILNAPIWLNIQTIIVHLTLVWSSLSAVSWFSSRKKYVCASLIAAGISTIVVLASFNPILFKISSVLISLVCFAFTCYVANASVKYLLKRTIYAVPVFVIVTYYAIMSLLAGIFLIARIDNIYVHLIAIPTGVICCVMEYIHINNYKYKKANSEIREQTNRYGSSVKNISYAIKNMFACDDEKEFFNVAVEQIKALLLDYNEKNNDLHYSIGIKGKKGYKEIINNNISNCNYEIIEKNCVLKDKNCIFSSYYFDYILKKEDGIYAIMHFENIDDGLDMFFESMIEAFYCALAIAFKKTYDKHGKIGIDVIFTELAENTEVDNGYSPDHLTHIQEYAEKLAIAIGLDKDKAQRIGLAGKLHDIGKIAIPKSIINKNGRLTEEEQLIVSNHANFGYLILSAFSDEPLLSLAAEIAHYHHEKYDGTGTNGLKGEEIPLLARIVTICDVYDALTSERSYKQAWSKKRAKNYMLDNKGKLFDPFLCDKFFETI